MVDYRWVKAVDAERSPVEVERMISDGWVLLAVMQCQDGYGAYPVYILGIDKTPTPST